MSILVKMRLLGIGALLAQSLVAAIWHHHGLLWQSRSLLRLVHLRSMAWPSVTHSTVWFGSAQEKGQWKRGLRVWEGTLTGLLV